MDFLMLFCGFFGIEKFSNNYKIIKNKYMWENFFYELLFRN